MYFHHVVEIYGRRGFLSIDKSLESKEIRNSISKIPPKVPPSRIHWGL
jgi:hypothetical protein